MAYIHCDNILTRVVVGQELDKIVTKWHKARNLLPWQPMVEFLGTPSEIDGGPIGYPRAKIYALCQYVTISSKNGLKQPNYWKQKQEK